jgi:hypothetical protein
MSASASQVPCNFFLRGTCKSGALCKFYHTSTSTASAFQVPCRFFQQGTCKSGAQCTFSHIPDIAVSNNHDNESSNDEEDIDWDKWTDGTINIYDIKKEIYDEMEEVLDFIEAERA